MLSHFSDCNLLDSTILLVLGVEVDTKVLRGSFHLCVRYMFNLPHQIIPTSLKSSCFFLFFFKRNSLE